MSSSSKTTRAGNGVDRSAQQLHQPASEPWKPPKGFIHLPLASDLSDLADADTELWAIRIPVNVRPKHLKDMTISLPGSSSTATTKVASVTRKDRSYELVQLGDSDWGGGEELRSISALVPDVTQRHLVVASAPITRHFTLTQSIQTPASTTTAASIDTSPPRPKLQPTNRLVHVFQPIGALGSTEQDSEDESMTGGEPPRKKPKTMVTSK